jgi:NCAIR mutase (PurE)-related protein
MSLHRMRGALQKLAMARPSVRKLSGNSVAGVDSSKTLHVEGHAKIDVNRGARTGFPEVVYASGKSNDQLVDIINAMMGHREANGETEGPYQSPVVASRVSQEQFNHIKANATGSGELTYLSNSRLCLAKSSFDASEALGNKTYLKGKVAIVCAGTSDVSIAEEAALMLELSGVRKGHIKRFYDVGVAGIYRMIDASKQMGDCDAIIAVAGMDGAMPSALAGLVKAPIIAIPTSVGYGAAFEGVAPLLTMLNSCAPGVSVVNIDNGIGAAASVVKALRNNEELSSQ